MDAYQTGKLNILAPDLMYAEIGNIVWKKHRFQGMSAEYAQDIIDEFCRLAFSITPSSDLLNEAYSLAVNNKRTVYDALYIALSIREQCSYVMDDEKLVNAIHTAFLNVIWIANWKYPIWVN